MFASVNWKLLGGGLGLLFSAGLMVSGLYWVLRSRSETEIQLPTLAIGGIVVLLVIIAMVAGAYALFNLANPNEALGLPEGSVRAIIALALIVLFAILTIYLYSTLSDPAAKQIAGLTSEQRDVVIRSLPPQKFIAAVSNNAQPPADRYTVYFYDGNPSGEDFAKQLLVMIGTLMTSVTSFYFAARPGTTTTPTTPKPSLLSVKANGNARSKEIELEIAGEGLEHIREVKLTQGVRQVIASAIVTSASTVRCKVTVSDTEPAGQWAVTVTDKMGQTATLPNAITLI